jgi:hypothetical protein
MSPLYLGVWRRMLAGYCKAREYMSAPGRRALGQMQISDCHVQRHTLDLTTSYSYHINAPIAYLGHPNLASTRMHSAFHLIVQSLVSTSSDASITGLPFPTPSLHSPSFPWNARTAR